MSHSIAIAFLFLMTISSAVRAQDWRPSDSNAQEWTPTDSKAQEWRPSDANAQELPAFDSNPMPGHHTVAITMSPVHLFFPMGEITGEYRLAEKAGIAVVLGIGRMKSARTDLLPPIPYTATELGTQFRYYLLGNFNRGMQIGAEVMYTHLKYDDLWGISSSEDGLVMGPFAGYKIATRAGFTFDGQLGGQYGIVAARATADGLPASSLTKKKFYPLLNANIGWSF